MMSVSLERVFLSKHVKKLCSAIQLYLETSTIESYIVYLPEIVNVQCLHDLIPATFMNGFVDLDKYPAKTVRDWYPYRILRIMHLSEET